MNDNYMLISKKTIEDLKNKAANNKIHLNIDDLYFLVSVANIMRERKYKVNFELSENGVFFHYDENKLFASWDDLENYYIKAYAFCVNILHI